MARMVFPELDARPSGLVSARGDGSQRRRASDGSPARDGGSKITRLLAIVEISRPAGARPARRDRRPSEPPCATAPRRRRQPDFPRRFALRWLQAKHAALQATISAAPQPLANTLPEIPATPTASARPAPRPQWLQKIFQEEESGQAFSLAGIAPVDPYGPIWFTCWDVLETYLTREGLIRQTLAGDARREAERPSVSPYREDDSPYGGKSGALARLMASRDAALKAGVIFPARRRRAFMEILQSRSPPEEAL